MSEEFSHTKGIIALVLGILSILPTCCGCGWLLGPIAIFMSNGYNTECIAAGVEPGPGKFGKILGVIGTILSILLWLGIIAYYVLIIVVFAGASM